MKHLSILFLLTLICSACFSASNNTNLYSPDIKKILGRGELHVAMYNQDLPYFIGHTPTGQSNGLDVSLSQDIANRLGVKLVLDQNAATFDDAVRLVASGQDDIAVSNLSATLNRALMANFTRPYYKIAKALVMTNHFAKANQDKMHFNQIIVSQRSIKIGVMQQSSYENYAKLAFPHAIITSYDTLANGLALLKAGKIDAIMTDDLSSRKVFTQEHDNKLLTVVKLAKQPDPVCIAVSSADPNLLLWLNLYLKDPAVQVSMNQWKKAVGL